MPAIAVPNLSHEKILLPLGMVCVASVAGGADRGADFAVFGAKGIDDEIFRTVSPVTHVGKNSPPVLIVHGLIAGAVDLGQSRALAAALREQGVAHELVLVEGAGHTFDLETWRDKPRSSDLRPVMREFLRRHNAAR